VPSLAATIAQATARLAAGPHPERARLDAETLLLHLTAKNRAWLLAHASDEFGGCTAINYAAHVERRLRGEPIQYITGACEFYGLPFRVTPAVLIPRPETEHLVEKALAVAMNFRAPSIRRSLPDGWESDPAPISNNMGAPSIRRTLPDGWEATKAESPVRILDIGTGSGAIAVALAYALPQAHITAVDLSPATLDVARANAEQNGVASRIRFLEGDLLAPVEGERFDLIVSNPPYVPEADRASLAVEVREHEPPLALFAGEEGLAIYRRLIPAAAGALVPGGFLVLEIGYGQSDAVRDLLAFSGFHDIVLAADLQGIPRAASAQRHPIKIG
jgi:release factor glutamine methyltransferase